MGSANPQVQHPCVRCGACCANYRVQFYWREAERADSPHPVPDHLVEDLDPTFRAMRGTNSHHRPRCIALEGKVGQSVGCRIYPNRPSPCRAFSASFENGELKKRCNEARLAHGMKPLRLEDWFEYWNAIGEWPDHIAPRPIAEEVTP